MKKIQARHTRLLQMRVRYSPAPEIMAEMCNFISQIIFRLKRKTMVRSYTSPVADIKGGMSHWDERPVMLILEAWKSLEWEVK